MATSFSPRGDAVSAWLFKDESAFGTPPSGNWTATPFYSHTLEEKQPFQDDNLLGQTRNNNRDVMSPEPGLPVLAGDIVVPLDLADVGYWLTATFGAPTTSGSGSDFVHSYASGGEVLPHRSAEVKLNTTLFQQFTGLLCDGFDFDANRAAGFEKLTFHLLGRKENKLTATAGGTPAAMHTRAPVPKAIATFKIAGTAAGSILDIRGGYKNNAVVQNFLGDPYTTGQDLDGVPSFAMTGRARFRDMTIYDLARYGSGSTLSAAMTFELLWQVSSTRLLSILCNAARFEPFGVPVPGPGGIESNFSIRAEQTSAAAMLTVTLKSPTSAF